MEGQYGTPLSDPFSIQTPTGAQATPARTTEHGEAATTEDQISSRLLSFKLLLIMEELRIKCWRTDL